MLDLAPGASCLGRDPPSLFHVLGSKRLLVKELWEQRCGFSGFVIRTRTVLTEQDIVAANSSISCCPLTQACEEPTEPTICTGSPGTQMDCRGDLCSRLYHNPEMHPPPKRQRERESERERERERGREGER